MRQSISEIVELDEIAKEYKAVVQVAGLRPQIVDICRGDAVSPADLRRMLTRTLQNTLPPTTLRSIRADGSALPADRFAAHERKVQDEVVLRAHESPTLRAVISKDQAGRAVTEFYGQKSAWMGRYQSPAMITKTIVGQPVRLPTIL